MTYPGPGLHIWRDRTPGKCKLPGCEVTWTEGPRNRRYCCRAHQTAAMHLRQQAKAARRRQGK